MRRLVRGGVLSLWLVAAAAAFADEDWTKGREAYFAGDIVGSMEPLKRSADNGNPEAQHLYGYVLVVSGFDEDGLAYVRKAAAQDHIEGLFELAALLERGIGTEPKPAEAREILLNLAARGQTRADIALANAYMEGRLGLSEDERNSAEALKWIERAAKADHVPALRRLVEVYTQGGFGLPADEAKAQQAQARLDEVLPRRDDKRSRRRK